MSKIVIVTNISLYNTEQYQSADTIIKLTKRKFNKSDRLANYKFDNFVKFIKKHNDFNWVNALVDIRDTNTTRQELSKDLGINHLYMINQDNNHHTELINLLARYKDTTDKVYLISLKDVVKSKTTGGYEVVNSDTDRRYKVHKHWVVNRVRFIDSGEQS